MANDFFCLVETAENSLSNLEYLAQEKNIKTLVKFKSQNELKNVYGDQGRLQQVLTNLLSNALKFTEEGG